MHKLISAIIVGAAFAVAAGAHAATTVISSGGVTAGITDGGIFDNTGAPTGSLLNPGLQYDGVEFVAIDNPASWWTIESSTVNATAYNGLSAGYGPNTNPDPLGSATIGPFAGNSVALTYAFGGLTFVQTSAITAPNVLSVTVTLTNNGPEMDDVKWGVGFDPDQGGSGNNITSNTILGQGNSAAVSALDALYGTNLGVTLANTTSASAFAIAAYINPANCCSPVDPTVALGAGQAVSFNTLADDSISLAYDLGTIGTGQTVTLGYAYIFAVPEPEAYAMMMAGLGVIGFAARRRKAALRQAV